MEVEGKEKDGGAGNEIYKKGFGGGMKETRIYVERRDAEEKVKRKSREKGMEVRGKIEGKKEKRHCKEMSGGEERENKERDCRVEMERRRKFFEEKGACSRFINDNGINVACEGNHYRLPTDRS